jgi:four helix bundle protein
LEISIGSCDETKIELKYSVDIGYITNEEYLELQEEYDESGKMLWGLLNSVDK